MQGARYHLSRGALLAAAGAAALWPLGSAPATAGKASALGAAASLGPLINIPQTWNNCGPAAVAEVLAYWGVYRTQAQTQSVLRVDGIGAGMTPYGVPTYARAVGLRAMVGVGGSETLVKSLIAAGFPVIVHQVVSLADLTGHWRPIDAYDDRQGVFTASDTYLGQGHQIGYADFAQMWAMRGNTFMVIYPPSRQAALARVLAGAGWHRTAAYAHDLALLRANQLDASPAGTAQSAAPGYRYLGMAWDSAQMGHVSAARAYLQSAINAGANPIQVGWVRSAIA